jgi:periplasmic copper chaperone A
MRLRPALLTSLAALMLLNACADPAPLYVDQAWIGLSPQAGNPSSGYFTVHGGPEAVTLRDVTADGAQRIEMHESMMQGGMMQMKPLDAVEVPAKTTVAFAPGGKHLMIWGINPAVVSAGKMQMTLLFSNGDRILVDAEIRKPGGGEQQSSTMNGMAAHHESH